VTSVKLCYRLCVVKCGCAGKMWIKIAAWIVRCTVRCGGFYKYESSLIWHLFLTISNNLFAFYMSFIFIFYNFVPHEPRCATQSAVLPQQVICSPVHWNDNGLPAGTQPGTQGFTATAHLSLQARIQGSERADDPHPLAKRPTWFHKWKKGNRETAWNLIGGFSGNHYNCCQ